MKRKVLMFAYDYPPRGWSGVQRTVKFVRYMPDSGWDPIVVTPLESYSPGLLDSSFSEEVAHAVAIRTNVFTVQDNYNLGHSLWRGLKSILLPLGRDKKWLVDGLKWRLESLFFPDEGVTWFPYAVKEGLDAVRKYRPEMIYATAPPYSTLISGWLVAKISGLPLIVDLRDLWVDNPSRTIEGHIKNKVDRFLEHLCLNSARAIITTTRTGADLIRKKYRKKSEKIYTIYNGYDENDFACHMRFDQSKKRRKQLTISHVGSLYADRSPLPFLKGLDTFLQKKSIDQEVLKVHFLGEFSSFRNTFKKFEHLGVVEIEKQVEHPAAVEIMTNSDVLLLIMPYGSERVIYAKVFEYLASGRPILGILPIEGEVAEMLRQAENGWIVDVGDDEGITRCLNEIYERWVKGQLVSMPNKGHVRKFERQTLTAQLCEIFEAVAG